jgi:creatinine amidohydrolase
MGYRLEELNWKEASGYLAAERPVVLPVAAGTKAHGPHLPLGTDKMVIEELSKRLAEKADVLVLPTLSYGFFPAFVDWPASVSIEADNFKRFVGDIIRSLAKHGARRFLILDGGVSTQFPLRILAAELREELQVLVGVSNVIGLGLEVEREVCEQKQGGHADEAETSCMLAIRPDLVDMSRAPTDFNTSLPGTQRDGVIKVAVAGKMMSASGIHGDASLATAEKGRRILDAMEADLLTFLEAYPDAELPK